MTTRPTHIAALDVALNLACESVDTLDQAVTDFLDENVTLIESYFNLLKDRARSYTDVQLIEQSIHQLGYPVLTADGAPLESGGGRIAGRDFDNMEDLREAIARRDGEPTEAE